MFESINHYVSSIIDITEEELVVFNDLLSIRKVAKKELLLKEGEFAVEEYFINKGCIRLYYVNDKGIEVNLQFAIENWWLGDLASFSKDIPSNMFIQAIEATEVCVLSKTNFEILLTRVPRFERFFRIIITKHLATIQERLIRTMSANVAANYLEFMSKYAEIHNRVPQQYIASYLGCTPEFLSKIRARLANSKL